MVLQSKFIYVIIFKNTIHEHFTYIFLLTQAA